MRIAVMGTGGMGGFYGAPLAAAGHDVTFLARGDHLAAMRENGLTLIGPETHLLIHPAKATDDPSAVGQVDVILFCVKLYSADTAAELIRPMVGSDTMVISLMNGVDGPDRIAAVLGDGNALGAAAFASAKIDEPGVISFRKGPNHLIFGEMDGTVSARALAFQATCASCPYAVEISEDIRSALWSKFVLLATNAGLTTLTRQPVGVVYGDPDIRRIAVALMEEVVAVAVAQNIAVPHDIIDRSLAIIDAFSPDMYASTYHDLIAGRPLEMASFSGLVARLGDELGVPTPHHRTVFACLKPYLNGRPN
ncbi:MAG: ketopantoate reductase family protein [Hyphomicrobiaceae bacterium]